MATIYRILNSTQTFPALKKRLIHLRDQVIFLMSQTRCRGLQDFVSLCFSRKQDSAAHDQLDTSLQREPTPKDCFWSIAFVLMLSCVVTYLPLS